MKKILSLIVLSALFASANFSNAQVYDKGNFAVDAFYGFPNLLSGLVRTAASTYETSKVTTLGPLGVTAEYLLTEKFGIGLEATYMSINAKYSYTQSSYYYDNNTNNYVTTSSNVDYEDKYTRLRVLPRVNFHFGNSDRFDPYLTAGIGYANFKSTHTSSDASYSGTGLDFTTPGNLATRVGFGVRYFFTDNFGFMAEGGIGGPLVRVGLSAKF